MDPTASLKPTKLVFGFFLDSLKFIPEALRTHEFRAMIKCANKPAVQSPPFSSIGAETAQVRFFHNMEATLTPTSSKLSYRPCMVRVQVVSSTNKHTIIDGELNLAELMEGDKAPMIRVQVKGIEPPITLVLVLQGTSAEKVAEERAAKEAARQREAATTPSADALNETDRSSVGSPGQTNRSRQTISQQQSPNQSRSPPPNRGAEPQPAAAAGGALDDPDDVSVAINVGIAPERNDHYGAQLQRQAFMGALEDDDLYGGSEAQPIVIKSVTHIETDASRNSGAMPAATNSETGSQRPSRGGPSERQRQLKESNRTATAAVNAVNARHSRLQRREARINRDNLRRVERERSAAEASLEAQDRVRTVLDDVRTSILRPTRVEVDGAKANVPRSAQRAISATVQFADKFLAAPLPISLEVLQADLDARFGGEDGKPPEYGDDVDSDDEGEEWEKAAAEMDAQRPLLPAEAPLLLFVHDLIVMLRWEISPADLDHRKIGAWIHTLTLLLNAVLQQYCPKDVSMLLGRVSQARLGPKKDEPIPNTIPEEQQEAQGRIRRWWRSIRQRRFFRRAGSFVPASSAESEHHHEPRTILTAIERERVMGTITKHSALFHAAGSHLDEMWETHSERLVAPQEHQGLGAHGGVGHDAGRAFPMLSNMVGNVFYDERREPSAAFRKMAASPLWELLTGLVATELTSAREASEARGASPESPGLRASSNGRGIRGNATLSSTGTMNDPLNISNSPALPALQSVMAILALEIDMALHELLVQCVQKHIEKLPQLAFTAMAPTLSADSPRPRDPYAPAPEADNDFSLDRTVNLLDEAMLQMDAEPDPTGFSSATPAAFDWLQSALKAVYSELMFSEAEPGGVDQAHLWDNPLSVTLTADIMRLCLEQLSVAVLNENHRRLCVNLHVDTEAPEKKKKKHDHGFTPPFRYIPLTDGGCNQKGERVLCTIDDGLDLKHRLDVLEAWLDGLPVNLGPECRAALLPLRALCDTLVLPPSVLLDADVRLKALHPLPVPMQRALLAASISPTWEDEMEAAEAADARRTLAVEELVTPIPKEIKNSKHGVPPMRCHPTSVALPFMAHYRAVEVDFSFLDLVTLPSPYFGSTAATFDLLRRFNNHLVQHATLVPGKPVRDLAPLDTTLVETDLLPAQANDFTDGQMHLAGSQVPRFSAISALWDSAAYRTSIGLSASDPRKREAQLMDELRGPENYYPPGFVLQPLQACWHQLEHAAMRKQLLSLVADSMAAVVRKHHNSAAYRASTSLARGTSQAEY